MPEILTNKEIETMSNEQRLLYFENLKKYYSSLKIENHEKKSVSNIMKNVATMIRNYDFEVIGKENIPKDGKGLFVVNHSNAHDYFTMMEAFKKEVGIDFAFLASNEDLNAMILSIFKATNGVLMDRKDKNSIRASMIEFCVNMLAGRFGIMYPESTWNLHPYKRMLNIKTGAIIFSCITEAPILPTIYEYVEVPQICSKEKEIFQKCVVKIGKPIFISRTKSIFEQTSGVQQALENSRFALWKDLGIVRTAITDINQEVYLNHTYLKKFGGAGEYDTIRENQFIFGRDAFSRENEYHLDDDGNFVPGILTKEEGQRYIRKLK